MSPLCSKHLTDRCRPYSIDSVDTDRRNSDSASTSPSIMARNDTLESVIYPDNHSPLTPLPQNIAARVKARRATLASLTDDMKSAQTPDDRMTRQPHREEEFGIHTNLTRPNLRNHDDSLSSDSGSVSTSPSIIMAAKTNTTKGDNDGSLDSPLCSPSPHRRHIYMYGVVALTRSARW